MASINIPLISNIVKYVDFDKFLSFKNTCSLWNEAIEHYCAEKWKKSFTYENFIYSASINNTTIIKRLDIHLEDEKIDREVLFENFCSLEILCTALFRKNYEFVKMYNEFINKYPEYLQIPNSMKIYFGLMNSYFFDGYEFYEGCNMLLFGDTRGENCLCSRQYYMYLTLTNKQRKDFYLEHDQEDYKLLEDAILEGENLDADTICQTLIDPDAFIEGMDNYCKPEIPYDYKTRSDKSEYDRPYVESNNSSLELINMYCNKRSFHAFHNLYLGVNRYDITFKFAIIYSDDLELIKKFNIVLDSVDVDTEKEDQLKFLYYCYILNYSNIEIKFHFMENILFNHSVKWLPNEFELSKDPFWSRIDAIFSHNYTYESRVEDKMLARINNFSEEDDRLINRIFEKCNFSTFEKIVFYLVFNNGYYFDYVEELFLLLKPQDFYYFIDKFTDGGDRSDYKLIVQREYNGIDFKDSEQTGYFGKYSGTIGFVFFKNGNKKIIELYEKFIEKLDFNLLRTLIKERDSEYDEAVKRSTINYITTNYE